jgi:hypothetical protein
MPRRGHTGALQRGASVATQRLPAVPLVDWRRVRAGRLLRWPSTSGIRIVVLCFASGALLPDNAQAMSTARPEQFVCSISRILIGHVLRATNDDRLNLTIRVDQVLGVADTVSQNAAAPIIERMMSLQRHPPYRMCSTITVTHCIQVFMFLKMDLDRYLTGI